MSKGNRYDVAVIGAGVFGAWTAWHLAGRGKRVLLADAYGPGNARASSAGESRIVRMGYGADELYTRWAVMSLAQWKEFFAAAGERLFHETGVLWLAGKDDSRVRHAAEVFARCGVAYEELSREELEKRYPQIGLEGITKGLLEPRSGVLLARRAVAAVAEDAQRLGVEYRVAQITEPRGAGAISAVTTNSGERIEADTFVFACGAWLGKLFPEILGARIFPSRQEVFFFGTPAGDQSFTEAKLPVWADHRDKFMYGIPGNQNRGFKIADDTRGPEFDPTSGDRMVSAEGIKSVRDYVAFRFPALKDAPLLESRVCQYENSPDNNFVVDRHPRHENVWLLGGGSGHGFKHGPALGEMVAGLVLEHKHPDALFRLGRLEK